MKRAYNIILGVLAGLLLLAALAGVLCMNHYLAQIALVEHIEAGRGLGHNEVAAAAADDDQRDERDGENHGGLPFPPLFQEDGNGEDEHEHHQQE